MNIFTVLQVIFIVLKVLELIDWAWWMVFIPTYVSIAWGALLIFLFFMLDSGTSRRRKHSKWW